MTRDAFVDERIIRGQQVEDAAIFTHQAVEEHLGFGDERITERAIEIRIRDCIRQHAFDVAEPQPLPRKALRERFRSRIGQHPGDLFLVDTGRAQSIGRRQRREFGIGRRSPDEIRQPRRQLRVAQAIRRPRTQRGGGALETEQELRARQDRLERAADRILEITFLAAVGVELHQRREVALADRRAKRLRRQPAHDLAGAHRIVRTRGRAAAEDLAAARGVGNPGDVVRTDDTEVLDVRQRRDAERHADLRVRQRVIDRRNQVVDRPFEALDEGRGNAMHTGAEMKRRRLQRQAGGRLGHARIDLDDRLALAVDGDLNALAFVGSAEQHAARVAVQFNLEDVIAVSREGVLHRDAATRPEWRAVDARQLRRGLRHPVVGFGGRGFLVANRERRDLRGRAQVALHQRRRKILRVGDIVEAVADGVGRQQAGDVDVDTQHVPDRAAIFRAIETLERTRAGVGIDQRDPIDAGLEGFGERGDLRWFGTTRAGGRHHAGAQLANHLFGGDDVVGISGCGGVEGGERQLPGLPAIAVATGAVLLDHCRLLGGAECRRRVRNGGGNGCLRGLEYLR